MIPLRVILPGLTLCLLNLLGCNNQQATAPTAARPFRGLKIKVLIPDRPELKAWLDDQRGEWSADTGAEVEISSYSQDELLAWPIASAANQLTGISSPVCDVIFLASPNMGHAVLADLAAKIPNEVIDAPAYERKDISPAVLNHLVAWDRHPHAIPVSAECMLVYYRIDLFDQEGIRKRFEEKYGHPLAAPTSWEKFDQIAEFFEGTDLNGDGSPDHALVISSASDAIICRAATFAKTAQNYSFYFDVDTQAPLATGPVFLSAMEQWAKIAPTIANRTEPDPQLSIFTTGHAAMALGSSALAGKLLKARAEQAENPTVGKVACTALPGSPRVFEYDKQAWLDLPAGKLNHASVVSGLVATVPRPSQQPHVALDFLTFLTNRQRSLPYVTSPNYSLGPFRLSHLVDSGAWIATGWSSKYTPGYLAAMLDSLNETNVVTILRVAGSEEYHQSLDADVFAALRKETTPSDALAHIAESWRSITEARGPDRQRRQYRYSLGMPVRN